jgi:hypothetical protein
MRYSSLATKWLSVIHDTVCSLYTSPFLHLTINYLQVNTWLAAYFTVVMSFRRTSIQPLRRLKQNEQFSSLTGVRPGLKLVSTTSRRVLFLAAISLRYSEPCACSRVPRPSPVCSIDLFALRLIFILQRPGLDSTTNST